MHAHARSCMQMDGMHGVGPQWVCIWIHMHAYALMWMHMDTYACRVSLGWGSGRASGCICMHVYTCVSISVHMHADVCIWTMIWISDVP